MALSQPYPGIKPAYKGNVTETQDELNAWVERVHRAGIQVNCHANGDVAIDMFLTAVERAQKLFPRAGRASEDHALHAHQRRSRPAHQGARRGPGAVHDLRLLQLRQVRLLRRGADEALDGLPLVPRRRHPRGRRIGLQPRAVRAADGHSGDGHAHGLGRRDLGREPEDHRRRSAPRQHLHGAYASHEERSKARSRRASWRTSSCCRRIRTRSIPRRSRTSRSCAPLSVATPCTKHRGNDVKNRTIVGLLLVCCAWGAAANAAQPATPPVTANACAAR